MTNKGRTSKTSSTPSKSTDAEKKELLEKIKLWEDKYSEMEGKYEKMEGKYEAMESKYAELNEKYTTSMSQAAVDDGEQIEPPPDAASIADDRKEIASLKLQVSQFKEEMSMIASRVENSSSGENAQKILSLAQYLRINSLLLHGLTNIPTNAYGLAFIKYVVATLNELFPDLEEKVTVRDIDAAHLYYRTKKQGPVKVIIVKFTNRWLKNEIYDSRASLKNTDFDYVSVTEQLTEETKFLKDTVKEIVGPNVKVFSKDALITTKVNNRKQFIRNRHDLQKLASFVRPGTRFDQSPPVTFQTPGHYQQQHDYSPYNQHWFPVRGQASNYGRGRPYGYSNRGGYC